MSRHWKAAAVCSRCDEIFTRRVDGLRRSKAPVCSPECRDANMRTGRSMVTVACSGCGKSFQKVANDARRRGGKIGHYCTWDCYMAHIDRGVLGRMGGSSAHPPLPPDVSFARSSAGGLARARVLSKERLSEIARLGVEARQRMAEEARRAMLARARAKRRAGSEVVLGVRLGRR